MTYFITAPLLYKEIVASNFSSLFFGLDDRVRPRHQKCRPHTSDQHRLCQWVEKQAGPSYNCARHSIYPLKSTGERALAPLEPAAALAAGLYHKQELLAMVESIHLVPNREDRTMFHRVNMEALMDGQELADGAMDLIDTRRYTDLPGNMGDYFPILERMSVGSWMHLDSYESVVLEGWEARKRLEERMSQFMPNILTRYLCRFDCGGPLRSYPSPTRLEQTVEVNTLHYSSLLDFGKHLIVGADNVIHAEEYFPPLLDDKLIFPGRDPDQEMGDDDYESTPMDFFTTMVDLIAAKLSKTAVPWLQRYQRHPESLEQTTFTFVIHRRFDFEYPEDLDEQFEQDALDLKDLITLFENALDAVSDHEMDFWHGKWDIILKEE
jgi:hypothetical protein